MKHRPQGFATASLPFGVLHAEADILSLIFSGVRVTSPPLRCWASCSRASPLGSALAGSPNMGKIIRGGEAWSQVKLSTRRAGGGGACSVEFTAYLTCLDKTQANEEECKTLREALRRCMYAANAGPRANRHVVPINYHLQKVRR